MLPCFNCVSHCTPETNMDTMSVSGDACLYIHHVIGTASNERRGPLGVITIQFWHHTDLARILMWTAEIVLYNKV